MRCDRRMSRLPSELTLLHALAPPPRPLPSTRSQWRRLDGKDDASWPHCSSSSMPPTAMIGPSLPQPQHGSDTDGDSEEDDFIGPAAPSADDKAATQGMSAGARAFLEREERQREAENVRERGGVV